MKCGVRLIGRRCLMLLSNDEFAIKDTCDDLVMREKYMDDNNIM